MTVHRIITTASTPVAIGPRVSQWAYSVQPWTATGINVQVRADGGSTVVEAVSIDTGELIASARNIVALMNVMSAQSDIEDEGTRDIARAA